MLKRLDWHDRHGEGAAEDSDSSGSDTGSEPGSSLSSRQAESGDEELAGRRLEDLSEEDFESGSGQEDSESGSHQEGSEDSASSQPQTAAAEGAVTYWPPRRCKLCPGILLLSQASLSQHVASKKHVKRLGVHVDDGFDPTCCAEDVKEKATLETYSERLERVRAMSSQAASPDAQKPQQTDDKPSQQPGPGKRRQRKNQPVRKRPGKRQRAAAKGASGAVAP